MIKLEEENWFSHKKIRSFLEVDRWIVLGGGKYQQDSERTCLCETVSPMPPFFWNQHDTTSVNTKA